jgi:UDP-N-acetylglucosamine--N-acetylmuramyl-(pentapeptide) pyrophosphoryl-undecaprenol N-acetylglucosamine transferase
MGGFASGPGVLMAWLIRKPLIVHEQNAIAGMTNKILAKLSSVVLQAFPLVFKHGITMGNPVRQSICDIEMPEIRYSPQVNNNEKKNKLRLLIIGGSLGARKLNEVVPEALQKMAEDRRPEVIHQTGLKNIESADALYSDACVEAKVEAFIDDMPAVYEWADLVICRAGAMTVFELAAVGIASVLVPYPYAVDNHQTFNAQYLEDAGAAIIRQQDQLTADWLVGVINDFDSNRKKLLDMAIAARKLAVPDSAKNIADACLRAGGIA